MSSTPPQSAGRTVDPRNMAEARFFRLMGPDRFLAGWAPPEGLSDRRRARSAVRGAVPLGRHLGHRGRDSVRPGPARVLARVRAGRSADAADRGGCVEGGSGPRPAAAARRRRRAVYAGDRQRLGGGADRRAVAGQREAAGAGRGRAGRSLCRDWPSGVRPCGARCSLSRSMLGRSR